MTIHHKRTGDMEASGSSGNPTTPPNGLRERLRKHPLLFFFLIAYAISWILVSPAVLSQWGLLPKLTFYPTFVIKSFGPAIAAFIMTRLVEGKESWLELRRRLALWRVGWQWYAFILLVVPAAILLGVLALPGTLASFEGLPPHFPVTYIVSFIIIFLGGGPLGEEPGWRGFALPRLQARYGAFRASLFLGLLWAFWHLPDFLTSAQRGGPGTGWSIFYINLPIFLLMVTALTFVFTWVFNHTRGSVFIAMLLHASLNTFGSVQSFFSAPLVTGTDLPWLIGFGVLALFILALTRGGLGYRPAS